MTPQKRDATCLESLCHTSDRSGNSGLKTPLTALTSLRSEAIPQQSTNEHNFAFPYTPYSIQVDFMNALYEALENKKVGLFESPTGTGKSLSLICGSLRWLFDQEEKRWQVDEKTLQTNIASQDDQHLPAWMRQRAVHHERQRLQDELTRRRERQELRRQKVLERERSQPFKKRVRQVPNAQGHADDSDDDFLVSDYESDTEEDAARSGKKVQQLLSQLEEKGGASKSEEENFDEEPLQIIFCSRTHSQLAQFISEMKRTTYAPQIKVVTLGSRKSLCVNEKVVKLAGLNDINDKCLDLQKAAKGCPFLPKDGQMTLQNYQEHVISEIRDIEELVVLGKRLDACPYYGTRKSVKYAQVVAVPYNLLIQRSARESSGINLRGSVVIIDEAHNINDVIGNIYSVVVLHSQLCDSDCQLSAYLEKYRSRLKGKNVDYIQQLLFVFKRLQRFLQEKKDMDPFLLPVNDFTHSAGIDHYNVFKLQTYINESHIARKLKGFANKTSVQDENSNPASHFQRQSTPKHQSPLQQVASFMMALVNSDKDGRICVTPPSATEGGSLKYLLLNPANCFQDIIKEARSVILAGGTMEPVAEFAQQLFPDIAASDISHFSCGHIVPTDHLLTMIVGTGPTGREFNFSFDTRGSCESIQELGIAIANYCNIIPAGVVCFFPSYGYLETVIKKWEASKIVQSIGKKKKVFLEPKSAKDVDGVLKEYAHTIEKSCGGGAILFCVVGGKLSEGINFKDDLGRGVIMVGLPFPNFKSPELIEKLRFVVETSQKTTTSALASSACLTTGENSSSLADLSTGLPDMSDTPVSTLLSHPAGRDYYDNICMRAVNQSIGRAIRHKGDYAVILLLDKRYATDRIKQKLPRWIRDEDQPSISRPDFRVCGKYGQSIGSVAKFFQSKK